MTNSTETMNTKESIPTLQAAVEKHISKLKENNKIKRIGADKGGYWETN